MAKYQYGKLSKKRMKGVNYWLVLCANIALSNCKKYDQTIPWMGGLRLAEDQNRIFKNGASQLDGYKEKSYHQSGNALDVVPYHKGKADYKCEKGFREFAKCMFNAWQYIQKRYPQARRYRLEYGGHWMNFVDNPHWQLIEIAL